MAQYTVITSTSPKVLSDGTDTFRYQVRSGVLYLDQEITATGFDGVEGTDWDSMESIPDSGGGVFRHGARTLYWNVDGTITGTGFSGSENTDWENIEQHRLTTTTSTTSTTTSTSTTTTTTTTPPFISEYQSVYDAMTSKPNNDVANAQDAMVSSLVADGIWSNLDVLYIYAQHTNGDSEALINWINPGTTDGTLNNSPTFAALEGFTAIDTGDHYVKTNWDPSNNGSNFTQNDASFGVYVRTDTSITRPIIGNTNNRIYPRDASDDAQFSVTDTSFVADTNADARGFYIAQRTASNSAKLYKNGSEIVSTANASEALTTNDFTVGRAFGSNETTQQFSVAFMGGSFTSQERSDFEDAIETYMESNGKGIIP